MNLKIFRDADKHIRNILFNSASESSQIKTANFLVDEIGISPETAKNYPEAQFNTYSRIWRNLQALRVLGDDLWKKASLENILAFSEQLRNTKDIVNNNAIYFSEPDYEHLTAILKAMSEFRLGKLRVYEIRRNDDISRLINIDEVDAQIKRNGELKLRYEAVLKKIRASFRDQLSRQKLPGKA